MGKWLSLRSCLTSAADQHQGQDVEGQDPMVSLSLSDIIFQHQQLQCDVDFSISFCRNAATSRENVLGQSVTPQHSLNRN